MKRNYRNNWPPSIRYKSSWSKTDRINRLPIKKTITALVDIQCEEAALTMLALITSYEANRNASNLVNFLDWLWFVCYLNNDSDLSYTHYKWVSIVIKLLYNFVNPKPEDQHRYKEDLKNRYAGMTTTSLSANASDRFWSASAP